MSKLQAIGIILITLFVSACQPDEIEDVNTDLDNHRPYFLNSWQLSQLVQRDLLAAPGQLDRLDLTTAVPQIENTTLTLQEDAYAATGILVDILGAAGSWQLDNEEFATEVLFTTDQGDMVTMQLDSPVLSFSDELSLNVLITDCRDGAPVLTYTYTFNKQ